MNRSQTRRGDTSTVRKTLLISTLCLNLGIAGISLALDDVNLHVTAGVSPNALVYQFTREKGFYRQEGLEVLPIQAGTVSGYAGTGRRQFPRESDSRHRHRRHS
jgi:hypothetical protein